MQELEDRASAAWGLGRAICASDFVTVDILTHELEGQPVHTSAGGQAVTPGAEAMTPQLAMAVDPKQTTVPLHQGGGEVDVDMTNGP